MSTTTFFEAASAKYSRSPSGFFRGEFSIGLSALLTGCIPVVLSEATKISHPIHFAFYCSLFASIFCAFLVTKNRQWQQLFNKALLAKAVASGFIIGTLYFGIIFWTQQFATATLVSILLLSEVFFSMAYERISGRAIINARMIIAGSLMVLAALISLLGEDLGQVSTFCLILVFAPALPPVANAMLQDARKQISGANLLLVRSVISSIAFFAASFFVEDFNLVEINASVLILAVINGVFLLGVAKLLWIEGLATMSISKAMSINCLAPIATLLISCAIALQAPHFWQLMAIIPLMTGCYLLGGIRA